MKKCGIILIIGMFVLINILPGQVISEHIYVKTETPTEKQWTLMLYDDADFNNAFDPLDSFASEAFSSGNINVVVLQDKEHEPAKLWYIDSNHTKILLKEMSEINMGNSSTLQNFVTYCKQNYSAQRYMLFFYDHGMGWNGSCIDVTNNSDWLTMDEIQHALMNNGGVDFVCFSAPCLMGAVESAYELRNCTRIYIGSEEGSGYFYWVNIIEDICTKIDNNPNISNIQLGVEIVQMINDNLFRRITNQQERTNYRQPRRFITMSAVETSTMEELATSLDHLAKGLASKVGSSRFRIKQIHDMTQSFPPFFYGKKDVLDVYDFAKNCYRMFFFDSEIRTAAKEVMEKINIAVIANLHGISHPRAYGLTIYFPSNKDQYNKIYTTSGLDFTTDTQWDEFLDSYLT